MSEIPRGEYGLRERAMSYAAVCGAVAVSMGMLSAETAQASAMPSPDQQALIDQSVSIAMMEWGDANPALTANNPCQGNLTVTIGTDAELYNADYKGENQGQAILAPHCEIQLNQEILPPQVAQPAYACEVVKHEVGHILGLNHVNDPTNAMNNGGPSPEFYKLASPGCAALNRPIFMSDKAIIKLAAQPEGLHVSTCRTDVLHKNKGYKAFYCTEKSSELPGETIYDRYIVRTNLPYGEDGRLKYPALNPATVTRQIWDKNRKHGGKTIK